MSKLSMSSGPTIDIPSAYTGPPCILACCQCGTRVAHTSRIVSMAFRGHAGKAALFTEILNIAIDPPSILLMDSGAYTISEFICTACDAYLGWQFVRAHDGPERWKEGLFILELDFVLQQADPSPPPGAYSESTLRPSTSTSPSNGHDAYASTSAEDDGERGLAVALGETQSPLVQMQMQMRAAQEASAGGYPAGSTATGAAGSGAGAGTRTGAGADVSGQHKRAMSADPRPLPKAARQGHRSLQAGSKHGGGGGGGAQLLKGVQGLNVNGHGHGHGQRRIDGEERADQGPFWKPR